MLKYVFEASPESVPCVKTHHVQPEKADVHADINHVANEDTSGTFRMEGVFEFYYAPADVHY